MNARKVVGQQKIPLSRVEIERGQATKVIEKRLDLCLGGPDRALALSRFVSDGLDARLDHLQMNDAIVDMLLGNEHSRQNAPAKDSQRDSIADIANLLGRYVMALEIGVGRAQGLGRKARMAGRIDDNILERERQVTRQATLFLGRRAEDIIGVASALSLSGGIHLFSRETGPGPRHGRHGRPIGMRPAPGQQ